MKLKFTCSRCGADLYGKPKFDVFEGIHYTIDTSDMYCSYCDDEENAPVANHNHQIWVLQ